MIGKLFRSGKQSSPQRPSFRPSLESLERREVPSSTQTITAYNQLPTDMSNLQASLAARPADPNAITTNYNAVATDMVLLRIGASNFEFASRLQIDNALLTNGLTLVYDGFLNHAFIPNPQFVNVVQLGANAAVFGFIDSLQAGLFNASNGDAVL